MPRRSLTASLCLLLGLLASAPRGHGFDLLIDIQSPGSFTTNQLDIVTAAAAEAEAVWEGLITGYQPGINIPIVPIEIRPVTTGLAAANFSTTTHQGGFRLTTSGFVNINVNEIETFAAWPRDDAGLGLNFIDDILIHEIAHALGVGTLWDDNGLYVNNSFQYTGEHGVAAFQEEFDPTATYVPVENAGALGTINAHWDQLLRSSSQEGDPVDPFSLSPEIGLVDAFGRDFGLEIMTGALDPDFGEPFISNTTIQSFRDLGYTVVPEPGMAALLIMTSMAAISRRRYPAIMRA